MVTPRVFRRSLLSDRHNFIAIADEAPCSQYDFIDGFDRQLRDGLVDVAFSGFIGAPVERPLDKSVASARTFA